MNLGKKIIALSLVAVMSLQTVNATVMDRALSNYTPPQSATITDSEGNTVKSMFYTGSFYYRFTESATPPLMWTFSPPEVEVGWRVALSLEVTRGEVALVLPVVCRRLLPEDC